MTPPRIDATIRLDRSRGRYAPGDPLCAEASIHNPDGAPVSGYELSVLWRTVGKGEEDLAVVAFRRGVLPGDASHGAGEPLRIEASLPESPLSYDGLILRVQWLVRLRLLMPRLRDLVFDEPFRIGAVSAPAGAPTDAPPDDAPP